jgi:hypothetical protein
MVHAETIKIQLQIKWHENGIIVPARAFLRSTNLLVRITCASKKFFLKTVRGKTKRDGTGSFQMYRYFV